MSVTTLRQLLDLVEPDRAIWAVPGERTISAEEIRHFVLGNVSFQERFHRKKVAVQVHSEIELAPLLVLLDGICEQLTLVSQTLSHPDVSRMIEHSGSEVLITTRPLETALQHVTVFQVDMPALWDQARPAGRSLEPDEGTTRWVLATSGTTGDPKLVSHSLKSLTRTASFNVTRGREFRWGSLYNLTGFAGLQVFLQSWCSGACFILGRSDTDLTEKIDELSAGACSALSATPTMWRTLLMTFPLEQLPLKQITLGGEMVDGKVLQVLRARFPAANIIHIYASTEAGVGFTVRDGLPGFPAAYLEQPPRGVQIAVEDGRLLLKAALEESEYLAGEHVLRRGDGFIDTGDLLQREGDRFLFLGRANGTINVGGNKVHPEEVENLLLSCEGVQLVRVSSRKSPFTGALVQAEVVPESSCRDHPDELKDRLLSHCRERLAPYKVPAFLQVVEELALTTSGKMRRTD